MAATLLDDFGRGDARERAESWRYSAQAMRALSQHSFVAADVDVALSDDLRAQFEWPLTEGRRVVIVNGAVSERYSNFADVGAMVTVGETGGAYAVRIDGSIEAPVHVVYVSVAGAQPTRWNVTTSMSVVNGSARMIEQHVGTPGADMLSSVRRRIELSEGARLELASLSALPNSLALYRALDVSLAARATLRATHVVLGGRFQRLDMQVALAGDAARLESRGVFAVRERSHVDTHLEVRHAARDTVCDMLWRGVADDRARAVFHGAITVAEGADGSDAQLSNKNLLLSAQAEIDTQPVLEIYADEVKAAHGATVGEIDEQALFYLRSRGIPAHEARRMLVTAFCAEALSSIDDGDLRERFAQRVRALLPDSDD